MALASLPCPTCWTHYPPVDLDVIGEGLALVLQALIDAEATQHIGARP